MYLTVRQPELGVKPLLRWQLHTQEEVGQETDEEEGLFGD
jgi:hypothetical protein